MAAKNLLAIDLGAESGRAVAGMLEDQRIHLKEVHRFPTGMLQIDDHYYWNIYRFYEEIVKSINFCKNQDQIKPESMGIDTWGVDFGFLGSDGKLCCIPYAYRDPQTAVGMEDFFKTKMSRKEIYMKTGIAVLPFNSVFHLNALKINQDPVLDSAQRLLFMPDILNYLLTGVQKTEFSFATTSQLYNPVNKVWESRIFNALGIDEKIMPEVGNPGKIIGNLKSNVAKTAAVDPFPLMSVCSHDTGSAIVAIPAEGDNWAYISSGTWSLMGIESRTPIINEKSFEYNFTNEGGAEATYRFLKNIMGLWLLQKCKKSWSTTGRSIDYPELVEMGRISKAFKHFIDPDDMLFYNPENMPLAIDEYCEKTGQESPSMVGEYVRAILEGLAFKYRLVLEQLREVSGKTIDKIHIIGGGTQNKLLCQFTSNATGIPVIAGPAEGTAAGNLLMQAIGMGYLRSLEEARKVVRNSFNLDNYLPMDTEEWNTAYQKFRETTKL